MTAFRDEETMKRLRKLCGYVENGTDTTVEIFQDDATKDWVVKVGSHMYFDTSMEGALVRAFDDPLNDPFAS